MLLSLFLVTQASILSFSVRGQAVYGDELPERTRQIIQNEVSLRTENQGKNRPRSETLILQDSYFQDSEGVWVDSADNYYWDQKWGAFNCYSYAMQRYDIVPEYYYFSYELSPSQSRWYRPGEISSYDFPNRPMTVYEQAQAVVSDFNVLGYTNVSTSKFVGTLPALGTNEELIAVRTTGPSSYNYDFHFMRYNKADGSWYHKPGSANVLKYKYALSEQLVWTNERPSATLGNNDLVVYSSDIWLIRYTRTVLTVSVGAGLYEPFFVDNIGDKIVVLDVQEQGHLDLSFWNINGFSAVLYTDNWDQIGYATYNPIEVDLSAGRYYIVMRNCRYWNYVYINASLSALARGIQADADGRSFAISGSDRLILGKVISGSLVEIDIEPITFLADDGFNGLEVVINEKE